MPTSSPKFRLDSWDFLKSLAVAALGQPLLIILTSFSAGHFNINWTEQWQMAVSSGAAYLLKNFFSGPPAAPGNGPTDMKVFMLAVVLLATTAGYSQSMFKPLPLTPKKAATRALVFSRSLVGPTDTLPNISDGHFRGFRFSGPDLAFAIPEFSVYTGLGIDFVTATADPATGKWVYDFTIGPRIYGGANLGVPTVQAIGAVGVRATFLKGWLAIGAIYNLTTKKPQATMGNPAALIPGLN